MQYVPGHELNFLVVSKCSLGTDYVIHGIWTENKENPVSWFFTLHKTVSYKTGKKVEERRSLHSWVTGRKVSSFLSSQQRAENSPVFQQSFNP